MRKISLAIAVAFAVLAAAPVSGADTNNKQVKVEKTKTVPYWVEPKGTKKRSYVTAHCAMRADNLKAYPKPTAFGNVTNSLFICRDR